MPLKKPTRAELQLQQENDKLKTTIVVLRRELQDKHGHVGRLEYLLLQRTARMDDLNGKLEQATAQNQRECERLVEMVRLSPS